MDTNDIKLVDFGLARNLDSDEEVKSSFGTPDFVGENQEGSFFMNNLLQLRNISLWWSVQAKSKLSIKGRLFSMGFFSKY